LKIQSQFQNGQINLSSLKIRRYEDFGCFAKKKTKPICRLSAGNSKH